MNAEKRVLAMRRRLAAENVSAIVVSDIVNVAYLTGFEGVFDDEAAHAAVITADTAALYTDNRYRDALTHAAEGTTWDVRVPAENLYATLCAELTASGVTGLALESSVPFGRFRFISEKFEGNVEAVDNWVEELRQFKEPEEIARIEAAQRLTDRAFDYLVAEVLRAGVTERAIGLELEFFMRREGSDGVAFSPIVASGPNSAMPHASASYRALQAGDFVVLDFGARVDGYCADMTRTVVVGAPTDEQRAIYRAVLDANLAGIAAAKPGMPGKDIDAIAREVIVGAGYGDRFGHGLGHGVGRAVHELPNVGPRSTKSVLVGNVITIEPGVYIPGFGGVRIEDLAVMEDAGVRVLTSSTKELLEV